MTSKVTPNPVVSSDSAITSGDEKTLKNGAAIRRSDSKKKGVGTVEKQCCRTPAVVQQLNSYFQTRNWTLVISAVTIYALLGDDMRLAFCDMESDTVFEVLSTISLFIFLFEFVIMCWGNTNKYLWSFFFFLDVVATISMIPDIPWIWEPLLDLFTGSEGSVSYSSLDLLQASRAGSKSGRIVRIVRLVRLVRVAKLWSISKKNQDEKEEVEIDAEPTVVGQRLSDATMKRVITIVLVMLISQPFLDGSFFMGSDENADELVGLNQLHRLPQDMNISNHHFEIQIQDYVRNTNRMIFLSICNEISTCRRFNNVTGGAALEGDGLSNVWTDETVLSIAKRTIYWDGNTHTKEDPDNTGYIPNDKIIYGNTEEINREFRVEELVTAHSFGCYAPQTIDGQLEYKLLEPSDISSRCHSLAYFDGKRNSQLSAVTNILRTIFISFILVAGNYVLGKDAERIVIRPIERMVGTVRGLAENPMASFLNQNTEYDNSETALLERTINKVGHLLQIGFGEAGSRIIAKNMANNDSSDIDPLVDGEKMTAVFGFCDIRNFTDTTECLQEKVMVYVNKVGSIVHEATHLYQGAANKNIGDAFLLVWRMESSTKNMCDNALVAFLKVIIDLKRENGPGGNLHEYKSNGNILKRFGDKFEIRLGMGLHVGWAIEGAIGSRFKIDASYLSPNVNMAARLEAATKQFRTPLLLSDQFFEGLSPQARVKCRKIDLVTVKGSIEPMGIYTCDITDYVEKFAEPFIDESGQQRTFEFSRPECVDEFHKLQKSLSKDFVVVFKRAIDLYLEGEWGSAKASLEKGLTIKPEDGPSIALLGVLTRYDFQAPTDWKGYRELTEK